MKQHMNLHLRWTLVFFTLWAAYMMYRLARAVDIQDIVTYWATLPLGFWLSTSIGYHFAMWRVSRRRYHIDCETGNLKKAPNAQ